MTKDSVTLQGSATDNKTAVKEHRKEPCSTQSPDQQIICENGEKIDSNLSVDSLFLDEIDELVNDILGVEMIDSVFLRLPDDDAQYVDRLPRLFRPVQLGRRRRGALGVEKGKGERFGLSSCLFLRLFVFILLSWLSV